MATWREELDGSTAAAADVDRLDRALGLTLPGRDCVEALLDPRGPLFQRLEYVGDSLLDAVVVHALVQLEPWDRVSLALVNDEQQALVSDHALARVAARHGLPDVRAFPASRHRLGDRIEAAIGAAWADIGVAAAEQLAWRLVLTDGLHGRRPVAGVPDAAADERYGDAAAACGHEVREVAWFGAAASGGAPRRRLAVLGNAVLEAACSAAQFVEDPLATEATMSEERRDVTSNEVLAGRAADLGLREARDPDDHRSLADEAQALVGAATMDGGLAAGLRVASAVLRRTFAPGPVAFAS